MELDVPKVMGVLNVTPDSFYTESRKQGEEEIRMQVKRMLAEGVDIIDVGGCSTRPGFTPPDEKEEWARVNLGCRLVREVAPDMVLSVDTFRASVAKAALSIWNADIINDISGGADPEMFDIVARYKAVYVLTHNKPDNTGYGDITSEVITDLSKKVNTLHRKGVNDIILDPGFGFAKTLEENFRLFNELEELGKMGLPLLVGVSRKSMIFKTLGCTPEESLTGTIALNAIALEKGANILRVHDVKEAAETVKIYQKIKEGL